LYRTTENFRLVDCRVPQGQQGSGTRPRDRTRVVESGCDNHWPAVLLVRLTLPCSYGAPSSHDNVGRHCYRDPPFHPCRHCSNFDALDNVQAHETASCTTDTCRRCWTTGDSSGQHQTAEDSCRRLQTVSDDKGEALWYRSASSK